MSTRTQISLTDDQRHRIKELASAEGVSMAEVIRRAIDRYLDEQVEPDKALTATFGVAKDFEVPSRDEWKRGWFPCRYTWFGEIDLRWRISREVAERLG